MLNEPLLDQKLAELESARVWSPRLISKLESLIRSGDDWALFRVNPFAFAEERGVSEDEAVDLFLTASKLGLFQMTWSLLCPGCGDAVQSFATLKNLCAMFRCFLCSTDVETRLDDFVHVGFNIAPQVRTIGAHAPESLSVEDFYLRYHFSREGRVAPGGPRFAELVPQMMLGLSYIAPHQVHVFEGVVAPGEVAVYDMISTACFTFVVSADARGDNPTQRLRLQDGKLGAPVGQLAPGPVRFEVENDSDRRLSTIVLMKPQWALDQAHALIAAGQYAGLSFDRFLSGRRVLTSQTFRTAFAGETIRSADGLGVRDVSILFTDLKGSTAMYDRIGDLKAFALVNQHFERLGRAIARHRGAVVKTIGDAVMASFEQPADAVLAACEMLDEIEAFNCEVGEREIVLKIGIHRGASIAVTLNDRLDFFGQTVNVAARVQGLADADEIYVTEEVYRAPGVAERLGAMQVTPQQAQLKGVQRAVSVYRVARAAPAADAAS